jgi:hypothetical protein
MQSVGDVAQLAEGFGDLTAGTFQSGLGRGVAACLLGKQAEFEGQSYQTLLRTVMQVSFQAAPLILFGFDNPGT